MSRKAAPSVRPATRSVSSSVGLGKAPVFSGCHTVKANLEVMLLRQGRESHRRQCPMNIWAYGAEMAACATNFFGGEIVIRIMVTKNVGVYA